MSRELDAIPEHMHEAIRWWIEKGEPHPSTMGSFFRAVLCNDLTEAAACADHMNQRALFAWAVLLYHHFPLGSWGDEATLLAWYEHHHAAPL